jgi:hypothetical protein
MDAEIGEEYEKQNKNITLTDKNIYKHDNIG